MSVLAVVPVVLVVPGFGSVVTVGSGPVPVGSLVLVVGGVSVVAPVEPVALVGRRSDR